MKRASKDEPGKNRVYPRCPMKCRIVVDFLNAEIDRCAINAT
jgi:hypothetical protein